MNVRKLQLFIFASLILFAACRTVNYQNRPSFRYIQVSRDNPSYFSFSDGSSYIPVGINMINAGNGKNENIDSAFQEIDQWMKNLSENGGNYIRVWLSYPFWDIEDEAGKYNEEKARRIDRYIEMARKYKLRIKMTLEHFRNVTMQENPQWWATKYAYHTSRGGPFDSIGQYLSSPEGRRLFLNKLDFYKKRYGSDTLFFGWELWNEMNAMKVPLDSVFFSWNEKMLSAVKKKFPENLVMQSLGSFDGEYVRPIYKKMMHLPGNEVAQVHRYLDLGAELEICRAPMDIICASAVRELLAYHTGKPVILAETGAVEPGHAGPSKYYPRDTAGILLHDILFAPFFSGAAGTGMSWHWESYVQKNNLWYHFRRFNEVIKNVDPIREAFIPLSKETSALRIYILKGKNMSLVWIRDKLNTWESELDKGVPPETLHGIQLSPKELGITGPLEKIEVYDPWNDSWTTIKEDALSFTLPDFKRSVAVRFILK